MDNINVFVLDHVRVPKCILRLVREWRLASDVECSPLLLAVVQINLEGLLPSLSLLVKLFSLLIILFVLYHDHVLHLVHLQSSPHLRC